MTDKIKNMKRILASIAVSAFPLLAFAQYNPGQGIGGLFGLAGSILKMALPLIISLAVVYFIWNVFRFVIVENEEDKSKAKGQMIWGIVAIFVMVSVWGLVGILQSTFGTSGAGANIGNQLPL